MGFRSKGASASVRRPAPPETPPPPPPSPPPGGTEGTILTLAQFASAADPFTGNAANYTYYNAKIDRALTYGNGPGGLIAANFKPHSWQYHDFAAVYATSSAGTTPTDPTVVLRQNANTALYTWLHNFGPPLGTGAEFATDPGLASWRSQMTSYVSGAVAAGWKGVMLDDVNPGGINTYNSANAYVDPRDPRTGAIMTLADWRRYHAELVEQVKAVAPAPFEVVSNMHWPAGNNGFVRGYSDPYIARIIDASDYILMENGLSGMTGDNDVAWTFSFAAMREFVDFAHASGTGIAWFNYDSSINAEYQLAMYLLLNGGKDYVGVVTYDPAAYPAMYDFDLGGATSARYQWTVNGVPLWRRDFASGMVLVNGPGMATVTGGALGGTWRNSAGTSITTITLAASQGAVLRP